MRICLLLFLTALSCTLPGQDFPAVTAVCTAGSFDLSSPLTDGENYTYRWERSFDGGSSWQVTGTDSSGLVIPAPNSGISYRLNYAVTPGCLTDPSCATTTNATRTVVDIPEFSQGLSTCQGDTVWVGNTPLVTEGNHRTVLTTGNGCDSIVNTFLQLLESYDERYFVDLCPGELFAGQLIERDTIITASYSTTNSCDSTVTYEIGVAFGGAGAAINGPQTICTGETATLRSAGRFAAYRWSDGSINDFMVADQPGEYTVTLTDFSGCEIELNHQLQRSNIGIEQVLISPPDCPNTQTASLEIVASSNEELLYSVSGIYQQDSVFDGLSAGNYTIAIENAAGCTADTTVEIAEPPMLAFTASPDTFLRIERGDSLPLTLETNFAVSEWRWSAERWLSCADCADPIATPTTDIQFTVTAVAAGGCSISRTFDVAVADNRRVYIPTAFSPNGDDKNDRWQLLPGPRSTGVSGLQIADRWGGVRFRQPSELLPPNDELLAWDGTDNGGQPLPVGTYHFTALVNFSDGSSRRLSGPITLMR